MKLTRTLAIALLASAAFAGPAMADCVYPKTPMSAPNGNTATKDEMIAGKQALDSYQAEVNTYLECLDKESSARVAEAGDNAEQVKQIKQMTAKKHNAAIDELQARADEFNQQLRAYKNKNKG
jgi:membrane-anchored protein YejM (alkaline phosphatase superfamily)